MEYFYYIVMILTVVLWVVVNREGTAPLLIFMTVISLFLSVNVVKNYDRGVASGAIVKAQQPIIRHYEEFVKELDVEINNIAANPSFTLNRDTPVKSLVEAKLAARVKLLDARKAIDEAKLTLEEIKMGLFGFTLDWIDFEGEVKW